MRAASPGGVGNSCGALTTCTPAFKVARIASMSALGAAGLKAAMCSACKRALRSSVVSSLASSVGAARSMKPVLSCSSTSSPSVRACATWSADMIALSLSNSTVRLKFFPPLPQLSSTDTLTLFTFWM